MKKFKHIGGEMIVLPKTATVTKVFVNGKQLDSVMVNYKEQKLPAILKEGDLIGLPKGTIKWDFSTETKK